ncbi:G-rich sequence factor 1 [Entelurus aequoreus]|uniref:G-rich sequence factor 1 n=1 Tax=Entelurus aequoreus TaxID=161455 RepID=UPI002B1E73A0|nr:G-rich sequence factor 1 [Entelurus aequoreus]
MSRSCRSVLALLHRCVAASHLTTSARCAFVPSSTLTSKTGTDSLRGLQVAVRRSLCSKAPYEDDTYPPLPAFQVAEQPEKKDVYIVQVQGLPWACTSQDVVRFFSECQVRKGVSGVHMTMDGQGRPSGRAFVELEHEEDVRKALEKHRQYLGPRYVEVYEVTDSDAEEILKKTTQSPADSRVVKLRGLPFSCTENDIVLFFSGLDIIKKGITIITNRKGRNTGEAFVWFATQEAADEALQKDRQLIEERYIEVFPSTSQELQSRLSSSLSPSSEVTRKRVSPLHTAARPVYEVTDSDAEEILKKTTQSPADSRVVRLRGLPFSCTENDIVLFFSGLDIIKKGITIITNRKGRNTGEAFVWFATQEAADEALQKDRQLIEERYIEVFPSTSQELQSRWRGSSSLSSEVTKKRVSPLHTAARPVAAPRPSKTSSLSSHYVHLRGLSFHASGEDIVKFFSPLSVSMIRLELGPDGRPSGEADVYFDCHEDAVAAMSHDRMNIGGRYIELFLNSDSDDER